MRRLDPGQLGCCEPAPGLRSTPRIRRSGTRPPSPPICHAAAQADGEAGAAAVAAGALGDVREAERAGIKAQIAFLCIILSVNRCPLDGMMHERGDQAAVELGVALDAGVEALIGDDAGLPVDQCRIGPVATGAEVQIEAQVGARTGAGHEADPGFDRGATQPGGVRPQREIAPAEAEQRYFDEVDAAAVAA